MDILLKIDVRQRSCARGLQQREVRWQIVLTLNAAAVLRSRAAEGR